MHTHAHTRTDIYNHVDTRHAALLLFVVRLLLPLPYPLFLAPPPPFPSCLCVQVRFVHMQSAFVPPTCPGVLIVLSMVGLRTLEQMPEAQEYKQQQEWEDFINKAREEDDFDPGADE